MFSLALIAATPGGAIAIDAIVITVIAAIICATLCWASAERGLGNTGEVIDRVIARLSGAAQGDFDGVIPAEISRRVPALAGAMRGLFDHVSVSFDNVQRLALFDAVTALPNRINFRQTCEQMLRELAPGEAAALFFIDLDRFKAVNDTMGHACGDLLLGMVANRLRAVGDGVRADDNGAEALIGRLAGDEFTMFVGHLPDAEAAAAIARALLTALGTPFDLVGTEIEIGASIGIALRPDHGSDLTTMMRAADAAMYHAKEKGRGRAEYFTEELATRMAARAQMERELREAIDQQQFALVYQPQVCLRQGHMVVAEALLRWEHPRDGMTLPGAFIRLAEETGLIMEIGEWVIATVAETIARWAHAGIEQRLAINISQRQLDHAAFFRRLRAAMLEANAPATSLELEISETMAMQCSSEVIHAIALLRADGATIAIDEFGTGYSSLTRLRELPIDRIKLHRSLIAPLAYSGEARMIAQALIALIHGLGCEAVGQGIESRAQADVLRMMGCDVMQGFAIAEPMPEAAFMTWTRAEETRVMAG
ncbi:putative bifunctional diguanylate cyclase/phosphodiesterase [Sphingomonas qilianensis]|uniref:putative bifunctional diguanylate cyclase/phosphodiesterase n=1 Tax=Sphingomonas qilianensis TaxID=1736690 RepID=UPI0036244A56